MDPVSQWPPVSPSLRGSPFVSVLFIPALLARMVDCLCLVSHFPNLLCRLLLLSCSRPCSLLIGRASINFNRTVLYTTAPLSLAHYQKYVTWALRRRTNRSPKLQLRPARCMAFGISLRHLRSTFADSALDSTHQNTLISPK